MRFTIRLATPDQESWAWVGEAESKDDLDVILAEASKAIIIGFNVIASGKARSAFQAASSSGAS